MGITTSPVGQGAISNSVVITSSGSKYFLQEEEKQTGFFGFGGRREESSTPEPKANVSSKKKVSKPAATSKRVPKPVVAPKGVPTLNNWEPNRDGTITGIISGSDNFEEGERVTTSAIAKGKIMANQVVTTGSGSKYFLA